MNTLTIKQLCDLVRQTCFEIRRYRRYGHREKVYENAPAHSIAGEYIAQLLGYLRSSRIETGLLVNFGAPILYVKKFLMSERPS